MILALLACSASGPAYEGAWKLESSKLGEQVITAPAWEGTLLVADGQFARSYTRKGLPDPDDPPYRFHSNAGTWTVDGKTVVLELRHSNYDAIAQARFVNTWDVVGDRLTLRGTDTDFVEIWLKVEE